MREYIKLYKGVFLTTIYYMQLRCSSLYFSIGRQLARVLVTLISMSRLNGTLVLLRNYYGELGTVETFIYLDAFVLEIK